MFMWLAGVLGGKLKIYIITAAVIAALGGLAFAGYQAIQYGKLLCERATIEAVENERTRQSERITELEERLQEARHRARVQVREVYRAADPTGCLDNPDTFPRGMLDHLHKPD